MPEAPVPTPPIIVFEDDDLSVFSSVEDAASSIEPWDADDGIFDAFDAEARVLALRSGQTEYIGRWSKRPKIREWTIIGSTPDVDADSLAVRLRRHIDAVGPERFGVPPDDVATAGLARLIELVADFEVR